VYGDWSDRILTHDDIWPSDRLAAMPIEDDGAQLLVGKIHVDNAENFRSM